MPRYFEFEVSLCGIEPRIWRRIQLLADLCSFQELHDAIQAAGGWWDYHLHVFMKTPAFTGDPIAGLSTEDDEETFGRRLRHSESVLLRYFFGKKKSKRCFYQYDFGDSWICDVTLVDEPEMPEVFWRKLIAGERAFPHEDCGGLGGYERCVQFVKTGKDPWGEPGGFKEWLGGWEPEGFDLEAAKAKFDRVPDDTVRARILRVLENRTKAKKVGERRKVR